MSFWGLWGLVCIETWSQNFDTPKMAKPESFSLNPEYYVDQTSSRTAQWLKYSFAQYLGCHSTSEPQRKPSEGALKEWSPMKRVKSMLTTHPILIPDHLLAAVNCCFIISHQPCAVQMLNGVQWSLKCIWTFISGGHCLTRNWHSWK